MLFCVVAFSLLLPSLFGRLVFAEFVVVDVVVVVVVAAVVVAADVDDAVVVVVVDAELDVVVESTFDSLPAIPTLSMLPFLNIPCSSVIFAHFVGGMAFNFRSDECLLRSLDSFVSAFGVVHAPPNIHNTPLRHAVL